MKKLLYIAIPLAILTSLVGCYSSGYVSTGTTAEVSIGYNDFYSALSPYGRWIDYPAYGRVWICNEVGFRPYYSGGRWAYTSYGWTWASTYSWGWAPFHYGRWYFDPFYGWLWIPGYEWAPAWVSWRHGGGVYGWAPLHPGVTVTAGFSYNAPAEEWVFVPHNHITEERINNFYINKTENVTCISNTTVINNTNNYRNTTYVSGPQRDEVEKVYGHRIEETKFRETRSPNDGSKNGELAVYRPSVKRENNSANPVNNNNATMVGNNGTTTGEKKQKVKRPAENKSVELPANRTIMNPPSRDGQVNKVRDANASDNNSNKSVTTPEGTNNHDNKRERVVRDDKNNNDQNFKQPKKQKDNSSRRKRKKDK